MNTRLIEYRPPRIAMALLVVATVLHLLLPQQLYLGSSPWIAGLLAAAGFLVMLYAWLQFRHHKVAICPTAPTAALITNGVYSLTRNPMYLGMLLMLAGAAAFFGTLPFYAATAVLFVILDRGFCRYEEAKLAGVFGQPYLQYKESVRRWI